MGANTTIEWATHTLNFWEGCTKVSEGCRNCYAADRDRRFHAGAHWGPGAPRRLTGVSTWAQADRWNREAEASGIRPRVFVNSLSDILDPEVPVEWLAKALERMRDTPCVTYLLLTKRPELWLQRMGDVVGHLMVRGRDVSWLFAWRAGQVPKHIWVGTTVENQARADERIPHLLGIPAAVRFLSVEPMLGPVRLGVVPRPEAFHASPQGWEIWLSQRIQWVICGGESGHAAKPMHPEWARCLRDECQRWGIRFFFKQWGEWAPAVARLKRLDSCNPTDYLAEVRWVSTGDRVATYEHTKQCNLTTPSREPDRFEDGEVLSYQVGKKEAGRFLDGRQWNEIPEASR